MTTMFTRSYYRQLRAKGYTVTAAYWAVRRSDHFRTQLSAKIKADKKRASAAKKGWKTRRAKMMG